MNQIRKYLNPFVIIVYRLLRNTLGFICMLLSPLLVYLAYPRGKQVYLAAVHSTDRKVGCTDDYNNLIH